MFSELLGNGVCDDIVNRDGCSFDGGDCCLPKVNNSNCYFCECLAPTTPISPGKLRQYRLWSF